VFEKRASGQARLYPLAIAYDPRLKILSFWSGYIYVIIYNKIYHIPIYFKDFVNQCVSLMVKKQLPLYGK
jgi:hypothetical protein